MWKFRENKAETQDNYLAYKPGGKKQTFKAIEYIDNRLSVEGTTFNNAFSKHIASNWFLAIKFVKDDTSISYERGVFTILEVIGNIGGLMGIFTVAGSIIVGMFSGKVFLYSILSKMYQVEEPENTKSKCFQ